MATVEQVTPTNTGSYQCGSCTAEYQSPLAAAQCEDDDKADDIRTRQWFNRYNDHTTN